jgi:hypothetical protein
MKLKCLVILFVLFLTGCHGSSTETSNQPEASASAAPQSSPEPSPGSNFEKDLQFIRGGGFTYVWLISRKDGKPLDPGDTIFLKANAPQVVDWVRTDEGRKVFAGTNFNLEEGNLEVLKRRYNMEDYSGK